MPMEAAPTAIPLFRMNHLPTEELQTTTPKTRAAEPAEESVGDVELPGFTDKGGQKKAGGHQGAPAVINQRGAIRSIRRPEKIPPIP